MNVLINRRIRLVVLTIFLHASPAGAHEILFCGEAIPTSREFVANKLMNAIRDQIPTVTLTALRYKARYYFPYIEAWLRKYGIPEDFKYIPIVECGFRNLQSRAGARGFWQLMPDVARNLGLVVNPGYDERDYAGKSTVAACVLIRQQYDFIKKNLRLSSWVLTAAAYNFGISNIQKNVQQQGDDYFNMKLNAETAEYVYRLIAVKELFEHPELYMKGFGANIFTTPEKYASGAAIPSADVADPEINTLAKAEDKAGVDNDFASVDVTVRQDGEALTSNARSVNVKAHIIDAPKKFRDGGIVTLILDGNLQLSSGFIKKGGRIQGQGWIIDDRVYVDLGYNYEVEVLDKTLNKGLTPGEASDNKQRVVLQTFTEAD